MHWPVIFLAGTGIGFLASWCIWQSRYQTVRERAKNDLVAERATMIEQLHAKDTQLSGLRQQIQSLQTDLEQQRQISTNATAQRAAAETKAARTEQLQVQVQRLQTDNGQLIAQLTQAKTQLQEQRQATDEKLTLLQQTRERMEDVFKALSAQALQTNNEAFLETFLNLAQTKLGQFHTQSSGELQQRQRAIDGLVQPLQSSLAKVETYLQDLERNRLSTYSQLSEQITHLATGQLQLQTETANLTKALRAPNVRGRWGEIQLKRVVEIAGMVEHCDFTQQVAVANGALRPDMVVQLPQQRRIVVDAKAPLSAYLEALDISDDALRITKLKEHAQQVRRHIQQLSQKAYWDQFQPSPEFVVLFLPGEIFFSAALEQDPSLIETGIAQRVILATPTTLIALLKAVAYGWQQDAVTENAQQISHLGRELYERMRVFTGHLQKMRRGLDSTVDTFNKAVGSLESRVLVSARKFKTLGAGTGDDLDTIEPIDRVPRPVQSLAAEEFEG
ncbi:DNA recombination protein RmuC [Leptothoe spongobia]|uniref:DNA recombination protein RmuC n=1 Tax=Leptothoe spongobia TAU-MAC 1115 TaxID=1967444 RepID=A0A947DG27_9CYAN|nr:DNA recombination protein RmuC [Leptothoe spongobia]MBT9316095.1 DNA recombination protein RmuC [Leptothoe spongobia TAU-MAC 1115]